MERRIELGTRNRGQRTENGPRRKGDDIAERLLDAVEGVRQRLAGLRVDAASKHVAKQLWRAATGGGANYEEARMKPRATTGCGSRPRPSTGTAMRSPTPSTGAMAGALQAARSRAATATSGKRENKISGAWWHPDHVDDILALRMLEANGCWDEYWKTRRRAWRKRGRWLCWIAA